MSSAARCRPQAEIIWSMIPHLVRVRVRARVRVRVRARDRAGVRVRVRVRVRVECCSRRLRCIVGIPGDGEVAKRDCGGCEGLVRVRVRVRVG